MLLALAAGVLVSHLTSPSAKSSGKAGNAGSGQASAGSLGGSDPGPGAPGSDPAGTGSPGTGAASPGNGGADNRAGAPHGSSNASATGEDDSKPGASGEDGSEAAAADQGGRGGGSANAGAAGAGDASAQGGRALAGSGDLSAIGLPLGTPALTLGIGHAAEDPVRPGFGHPPKAGILFNLDTGRVLWQRSVHRRLRIASLTKMMTAFIGVDSTAAEAKVMITKQAVDMPGSKVGELPLGKHVKMSALLYGLLLPSGNDAAVAIAQHVSGTVPRFVKRMNVEAARLGMGCTRYSSPSGYYDKDNFSCAADLAELAYHDLSKPRIAAVVRSRSAVLPFPIKGGKLYLYNNNPLLMYGYKGTTGLKTGYTEAAGPCLVATAEEDGVQLGVVLLDSELPGTQAAELLTRGFERVYHLPHIDQPPIPGGV